MIPLSMLGSKPDTRNTKMAQLQFKMQPPELTAGHARHTAGHATGHALAGLHAVSQEHLGEGQLNRVQARETTRKASSRESSIAS